MKKVILLGAAGAAFVAFVAWYNRDRFNRELFNAQVNEQLALDRAWWGSGSPDYTNANLRAAPLSQWSAYGVALPYFRP